MRLSKSPIALLVAILGTAIVASSGASVAGGAPQASSSTSAPVTVHAIFGGGSRPPFRVGQVLDVVAAGGSKGPGKIRRVCFSPAPISRPSCGSSTEGAPSKVGTTKITVTLSRLSAVVVLRVRVLAAATRVGGSVAVPATITCPSVKLYGSVGGEEKQTEKPMATVVQGEKVALYNVITHGVITMVDYATGQVGFGEQNCAKAGI
jgi:hypothetical protein